MNKTPQLDANVEAILEHYAQNAQWNDLKEQALNVANKLSQAESEVIKEYVDTCGKLSSLYTSLNECEEILGIMENTLGTFQVQLSTATTEIQKMQVTSKEYMIKVDNRKKLEDQLNQFINLVYIPDNLVRVIKDGHVNKQYVQYLLCFDQKVDFVESQDANILCVKDQRETITTLIAAASGKIFQWLLKKMQIPKENRTLQFVEKKRHDLKKYSRLFKFLKKRDKEKAKQIIDKYVQTTSAVSLSHFQKLISSMDSFKSDIISKKDLLGEAPNSMKVILPGISAKPKITRSNINVYSLSNRPETLYNLDIPLSFPEGFESGSAPGSSSRDKIPYEHLFRCIDDAFVEAIIGETSFSREFFNIDMSDQVLSKSGQAISVNFQRVVSSTYDSVGLMILQCIIYSHNRKLHSKGCHNNIVNHFNTLSSHLKARFEQVVLLNVESLRSTTQMFWGTLDSRTAHYITRKFSEFLTSTLTIKSQHEDALKAIDIDTHLRTLMMGMVNLLDKMGTALSGEEKMSFLINNYELINTTLQRYDVSIDTEYLERLLENEAEKYGESQLIKYFQKFLLFVRSHSVKDKSGKLNPAKPACNAQTVEEILKNFSNTWEQNFREIDDNIMKNFPNYTMGRLVVKKLVTNLYIHYDVFVDMINQYFKELKNSQYFVPLFKIKELLPQSE